MKKLQVSEIPRELMKMLINCQCTVPNQCFRNCALAVSNFDLADTYVLCFLEDHNGNKHGHALIKVNGKYFDPTLESQPFRAKEYWAHTEMTKDELRAFVTNWPQDIKINKNGEAPVFPPALLNNGDIACVEVSLT